MLRSRIEAIFEGRTEASRDVGAVLRLWQAARDRSGRALPGLLLYLLISPGLLVLISCAHNRPDREYGPHFVSEDTGTANLFRDPIAEQYPAAPALLAGFDELKNETRLHIGDRVLIAVELTEGPEQRARQTWFVRAEVMEFDPRQFERRVEASIEDIGVIELRSSTVRVRLELFDHAGQQLGTSTVRLSEDFLASGLYRASQTALLHRLTAGAEAGSFWPFDGPVSMSMDATLRSPFEATLARMLAARDAAEAGADEADAVVEGESTGDESLGSPRMLLHLHDDVPADDPRVATAIDVIRGSLSVAAVGEVLEQRRLFADLRSEIIRHCFRRLVLLELLLNIGAGSGPLWSVGFDYVLPLVDPLDTSTNGFERLQGYEVPLEFEFNGVLLMASRLVVVEPQRPLALTGGLLALDAFHPQRPDNRLQVRVIAARSGEGWSRAEMAADNGKGSLTIVAGSSSRAANPE